MNASWHPDLTQLDPASPHGLVLARPLARRRLQCYLALIVADLTALTFGYVATGWLYRGLAGFIDALEIAWLLLPVFLTIALYNGAYSLSALQRSLPGSQRALAALAISAGVLIFFAFYAKASNQFSRVVLTSGAAFSAAAIVWTRLQMRGFIRWRCGVRVDNELVIDDGGPQVDLPGAYHADARQLGIVPTLDDPAMLDRIGLVLRHADRVLVSCSPERRGIWAAILKSANVTGDVLDDSVIRLGAQGARVEAGHGWLKVSIGPLGMRARAAKRLFDVVVAGSALIVLAPLLLVVALAIKLGDGGPALFVQRRVGRGNRFFAMLKFRSMCHIRSDGHGAQSTLRDDARITPIGRLIRRTSIDELPQLWNVLVGDMSIVGPRPHALASLAGDKLFWEIDRRYWQRHALKPGLTGLAQIRGLRGATDAEVDLEQRLNADLEYLNGWSLWRDCGIVVSTIRVLVHDRAY
jgi:polysaccharide biosynthesis protein PslA